MLTLYEQIVNLSITTSSLKDTRNPDGEVCNEDGTLKEALEMDWPDSPSGSAALATLKCAQGGDENDGGGEGDGDGEDNGDGEDADGDSDSDVGQPRCQRTKRQRVS